MEREMTTETQELMAAAHDARMRMRLGQMDQDTARAIIKKYIDHVNEGGRKIAKEYGGTFRPVSVAGFLR